MTIPTSEAQNLHEQKMIVDASEASGTFAISVLGALMAQATDCIAVKDLAGRYLTINSAGAAFLGRQVSEIIGKTDFDLFSAETAQAIVESDRLVMFSGETRLVEDFLRPLNGRDRYFQAMKCAYRSASGEVLGIINVVRDISAAKLAEQALKQTNQDLEQFASVVSHDLQAPLRKIIYFSDVLEQEFKALPSEAADYITRIQKTSKKMSELVSDMLSLARIRHNKPKYTTINLRALIEEAIQEASPEKQNLKHCFELKNVDVNFIADAFQIRQLLVNMFSNALKFQKAGQMPQIQVESSITPFGQCLIKIQDNGIGFNEKHLSRMFKAFERLHGTRNYPGTGMGLAICERIVQRHGGRITAESKSGEGATFYVELPLTQD